jgi:hypothetical protein
MPAPNYTTAQSQLPIMLQVVDAQVARSQNLDRGIDKRFQDFSAKDMGKEKYRHPIQFDAGGQGAFYNPDGGGYPEGTGPEYQQFIVAPIPILTAFAATELLERIEQSSGLEIVKPISRMVTMAKDKMAHIRNTLTQGYNQGIVGTVDATYAGGNVVPLASVSFGNRLLDLNNQYAVTDASGNYNIVGTPAVLAKSNSTGATIDTVTLDAAPAGIVAGSSFLLMGSTSGAPLGPQGLQYIISTSNVGDMDGISRNLAQMQAAGVNANNSTLTLGMILALDVRQKQNSGPDIAIGSRFYYTYISQQSTARQLGFAKTTLMSTNGELANFNISPKLSDEWKIGTDMVEIDTTAAVDKMYWASGMYLKRVRYPGSQKFIPGTLNALWWPRYSAGQPTSERDLYYQDAYNYYTSFPWAHGLIHSLAVTPAMGAAI